MLGFLCRTFVLFLGITTVFAQQFEPDFNPFNPTHVKPKDGDSPTSTATAALPPQVKQIHDGFGEGVKATVEKAGNDTIRTVENTGHDVLTTLQKAGGDTITSLKKASEDTITTVQKAGSDVVATYEKGWRDTSEQTQRSFNDVVDAGKAVARFAEAQAKGHVIEWADFARRAREGKVIDALWGAAVEPAQSSEENFAKAVRESPLLNAGAQAVATAYGGPAGAAAYAAWYTYRATGDANLALKEGALAIVTSYGGGSVANMPAGTAGEVLRKAAVTGAVAGIATAAAGGDEKSVTDAVLRSGGTVLVQGASDQLKAYSPNAENAIQTVQCISARDVNCLSYTTYVKDAEGKLLYDSDGRPRIDTAKLDPKQYVGQWTGFDPNSAEGKMNKVVTAISKIPQTQSIPIGRNNWVVTSTLEQSKTLEYNKPAVVLTYVGPTPPFYSRAKYETVRPNLVVGRAPLPPPFLIFYDRGTDKITPEGMQVVRQAADTWKKSIGRPFLVTGYTDTSLAADEAQKLSERMARSVAVALEGLGIPRSEMTVSARGKNDNRVPRGDRVSEPQNRRVEVVFQ